MQKGIKTIFGQFRNTHARYGLTEKEKNQAFKEAHVKAADRGFVPVFILKLLDRFTFFLKNPSYAARYIRNGICIRFFGCVKFDYPTDLQHHFIDESKVISCVQGKSVLDCGCGVGRWGFLLKEHGFTIVGFDLAERYLKDAIRYNSYFGLVRADATRIPFRTKSFDCVVAVELIEHLQKPDGYTFLEETKRIARRRIVLSTPSGYLKSSCDTDEEVHRSGWNKGELEKSGFCCSTFKGELYTWLGTVKSSSADSQCEISSADPTFIQGENAIYLRES